MAECANGVYRPRRPRETAFNRLVEENYERFEQVYPERYEDRYGFFRSVVRETVYKYLDCGDLKQGFARVRCRECGHEYLLAYSCKQRYFCTSCHTKRAVAFAEWLLSSSGNCWSPTQRRESMGSNFVIEMDAVTRPTLVCACFTRRASSRPMP